jgi:acyl-CoA thioesterase-1
MINTRKFSALRSFGEVAGELRRQKILSFPLICFVVGTFNLTSAHVMAQNDVPWTYSVDALQPFWRTDVVQRESVLFLRDADSGEARASVLFPVKKIVSIENAAGSVVYKPDTDYAFTVDSREITVPAKSGIVTKLPADLRRPANSQKYRLTHRDGNGEILFGAMLEYHDMQTWVTYEKADNDWPVVMPTFDAAKLPRTIELLKLARPISIVLLGDSISTGCNSSGWGGGAPFQPAYQDLLREHLAAHYKTTVTLTNLSVGGQSTPWGVQQIDKVVEAKPDLVILAFGMNDSAGRSPEEFANNTLEMISKTRESLPDSDFILIAPMLGNRDWTTLKHDVFPQYRDELAKLCNPGVALADMTSVWIEFLKRKKDWDLTGNGVNHPNDFGHRVYAQVLSAILVD